MEPFSTGQAIAGGAYEVATIINKSNEKFSSEVWAKPFEDRVGCGPFGGGMDARRAYEILERSLERSFVDVSFSSTDILAAVKISHSAHQADSLMGREWPGAFIEPGVALSASVTARHLAAPQTDHRHSSTDTTARRQKQNTADRTGCMAACDDIDAGAAPPILASTLLQSYLDDDENGAQVTQVDSDWNLQPDIDKGIPFTKAGSSVFAPGRVIGISGLQPTVPPQRDWRDGDAAAVRNWMFELSAHILITLLTRPHLAPSSLDPRAQSGTFPQAVVIQFYSSRAFTSEYLLRSIQQKLPELTTNSTRNILNTVKVIRAFNFDEILEAVSQVSDILYEAKHQQTTLLLLEGLDQSLAEIQRNSSILAAQAKLIPLLRTLTILSRNHTSFLTVIVVNPVLLPTAPFPPSAPDIQAKQYPGEHSTQQECVSPHSRHHHHSNHHQAVHSIFSPTSQPQLQTQGQSQTYSSPSTQQVSQQTVSYSSLARSFDQGFDTHLLVSKMESKMIIEVAKDRMGEHLGRWCAL
ncbi:hypothetical protein CIHG_02920 [Coccidioides immitis H538.4]|uniref:Uncharacterized protein n=2 Tax=Coccidioides immitis TaxID=5501 RepID=A0A0J8UD06_COCIT|nr:hypothetical protein CIRG_07629 [Coccidioides immitis RMSCC 2394]KMU85138.1 hypothetical protein CIHG_02920 [Coccidioides immitis H538.4]